MYQAFIVIFAFFLTLSLREPKNEHHSCPFELCPYKGQTEFNGVIHTGENQIDHKYDYTDVYYIDRLHFEYPLKSYDELEDILSIQFEER